MAKQRPQTPPPTRDKKLTVFGEPLWLDALKTLGVAMIMLSITVVLGLVLAVMVIAPWGRASPDCSIYCVIERRVEAFLSGERS